jgi:hypothetical protein
MYKYDVELHDRPVMEGITLCPECADVIVKSRHTKECIGVDTDEVAGICKNCSRVVCHSNVNLATHNKTVH